MSIVRLEPTVVMNLETAHRNLSVPRLVEHAVARGEGFFVDSGALCVYTGKYTGRSPNDRFIVEDSESTYRIDWGAVNKPFSEDKFERLLGRVLAYLQNRELFIFDGYAGADPEYRMPVRFINEYAWQNLFVHQLFLRPSSEELKDHRPEFTVITAPGFLADPEVDGTNSEAFVVINLKKRLTIIGGTRYAGEMKKSVFGVLNYFMPLSGVFPMHCSANVDSKGNTALFFGLSGTGKTTLSADPSRRLIGDDEHGWSEHGIFNFEGGCYAKCIKLSKDKEPQIYEAIRFGSVIENVVVDRETRVPDYDCDSGTENTRAAYPVDYIPDAVIPGIGDHPKTIIFLTADAFGVLPPVSKLDIPGAMYHFLSGYTSKLAGTERGIIKPEATFSSCFGAPFLPLSPKVYGNELAKCLSKHGTEVYLVNTGWSGGPYGVGKRMDLALTRRLVSAALDGSLGDVPCQIDPIFNLVVPGSCPGVPSEVLNPRNTWKDQDAYDAMARDLAARFIKNFSKFKDVSDEVKAAGPRA